MMKRLTSRAQSARTRAALLEIPGVGPERRHRLLERFGSLAGVKSASIAEIAEVPGFSTALATRVREALEGVIQPPPPNSQPPG